MNAGVFVNGFADIVGRRRCIDVGHGDVDRAVHRVAVTVHRGVGEGERGVGSDVLRHEAVVACGVAIEGLAPDRQRTGRRLDDEDTVRVRQRGVAVDNDLADRLRRPAIRTRRVIDEQVAGGRRGRDIAQYRFQRGHVRDADRVGIRTCTAAVIGNGAEFGQSAAGRRVRADADRMRVDVVVVELHYCSVMM